MCLASTRLSDPGGTQGWVDLVGWLHTETVYPPEDGHPSRDTNRQVISIRPIPFNVILTELGLHVCFFIYP